ncbi:hypothetical protein V7x_14000 [Crateriforma conspicua]|uniref:Uncharacterized protein n=1 Tax=Crateriforma conspicua TaxID=2527996 RepID=A0A5C6FU19_9PLAN|nr:hypothetical protein V7x_14000 [Crateriforma conspicua]
MMQASCPRCNESVRLPAADVPGDTKATCPWCRGSFFLAEIQELLPPELILDLPEPDDEVEVIGGSEPPVGEQAPGVDAPFVFGQHEFSVEPDATVGSPESDGASMPSFDFDPESRNERASNRNKSIFLHPIAQMFYGLILAIPMALAILYAVGSPVKLGFWPFAESRSAIRAFPLPDETESDENDDQRDVTDPASHMDDIESASMLTYREQSDRGKTTSTLAPAEPASEDIVAQDAGAAKLQETFAAIDELEQETRSNSRDYWRRVVTVYSQVAGMAVDDDVTTAQRQAVLDRVRRSDRLEDLSSKTAQWISLDSKRRATEPLMNDGVIVAGLLNSVGPAYVRLPGGEMVNVRGDLPENQDGSPFLALGRLVPNTGAAATSDVKTVQILVRSEADR